MSEEQRGGAQPGESPDVYTVPGKLFRDMLSVFWAIQFQAEAGQTRGNVSIIEIPTEMVVLAGELIHEAERAVCDSRGDNPCPITRMGIWGGTDGESRLGQHLEG